MGEADIVWGIRDGRQNPLTSERQGSWGAVYSTYGRFSQESAAAFHSHWYFNVKKESVTKYEKEQGTLY